MKGFLGRNMITTRIHAAGLLMIATLSSGVASQTGTKTPAPTPPQAAPAAPQGRNYTVGPDSLPQDGVPKGKLEGPLLFKSQVIANTVRRYWIYVPAQYTKGTPANVSCSRTASARRTRTDRCASTRCSRT